MKSVFTEIPCCNRPVPRKPKNSDGKAGQWGFEMEKVNCLETSGILCPLELF